MNSLFCLLLFNHIMLGDGLWLEVDTLVPSMVLLLPLNSLQGSVGDGSSNVFVALNGMVEFLAMAVSNIGLQLILIIL